MRVGQRWEADGNTYGMSQQRLQNLHRRQVLIGRQDRGSYACTRMRGEMNVSSSG